MPAPRPPPRSPRGAPALVAALVLGALEPGCIVYAKSTTDVPFAVEPLPEGLAYAHESVHLVEWAADRWKPTEQAYFDVSQDGGATFRPLGGLLASTGRYQWVMPASGERARLRITIGLRSVETRDVPLIPSQRRAYRWTKILSGAPFGPRDGAGALVYHGKLWLIGGWNGEGFPRQVANDVWNSPDGVSWTRVKPNTYVNPFDPAADWEGRHHTGYEVFDDRMWIIGGDPVSGHYQPDVWSTTDGKKWVRATDRAGFGARALHMSAAFDGRLWVMGGQRIEQLVPPQSPEERGAVFNDVWSSRDGGAWMRVEGKAPMWEPRGYVCNTAIFKGRITIVGGGTYDDPPVGRMERDYRADMWSTADGVSWERSLEKPPFAPRQSHNVAVFDDRLWVLAGYNTTGNLGDAWYTVDGVNWYEDPKPGFLERHAASVWVNAGAMFLGSGNAVDTAWRADVWRVEVKH